MIDPYSKAVSAGADIISGTMGDSGAFSASGENRSESAFGDTNINISGGRSRSKGNDDVGGGVRGLQVPPMAIYGLLGVALIYVVLQSRK